MTNHYHDLEHELSVQTAKPKLKPPQLFKVVLINDDFTPMDFVVSVLEKFFGKNSQEATRIMLQVHAKGKAVCGIYTFDIAETKVSQVNDFSRGSDHPLLCQLEEA